MLKPMIKIKVKRRVEDGCVEWRLGGYPVPYEKKMGIEIEKEVAVSLSHLSARVDRLKAASIFIFFFNIFSARTASLQLVQIYRVLELRHLRDVESAVAVEAGSHN